MVADALHATFATTSEQDTVIDFGTRNGPNAGQTVRRIPYWQPLPRFVAEGRHACKLEHRDSQRHRQGQAEEPICRPRSILVESQPDVSIANTSSSMTRQDWPGVASST
jgi:hypothetical protein